MSAGAQGSTGPRTREPPRGPIGITTGGPGRASGIFGIWGKVGKIIFWVGFGGKWAKPKGSQSSWEPFSSGVHPKPSIGGPNLPRFHVFWAPFLGPQRSQAQPGPNFGSGVPNLGSGVPNLTPGTENQKDARRKTLQNPASRISNGAIWSKLWPKTILGRPGHLWIPFSEKMCQKPCVLHALRAARRSQADEPDEPDEAEMVHDRLLGP